jgi:hypothetical protein
MLVTQARLALAAGPVSGRVVTCRVVASRGGGRVRNSRLDNSNRE